MQSKKYTIELTLEELRALYTAATDFDYMNKDFHGEDFGYPGLDSSIEKLHNLLP